MNVICARTRARAPVPRARPAAGPHVLRSCCRARVSRMAVMQLIFLAMCRQLLRTRTQLGRANKASKPHHSTGDSKITCHVSGIRQSWPCLFHSKIGIERDLIPYINQNPPQSLSILSNPLGLGKNRTRHMGEVVQHTNLILKPICNLQRMAYIIGKHAKLVAL